MAQLTAPNILIVKLAAIGDVVMALPLLPALRSRYPQAHITWVCGQQVTPLLKAIPSIDRVLEVDEKRLLKGSILDRLRALINVWKKIGGKRFELILTLHPDPRYRLVAWPARSKNRRHWGKNGSRFLPVPGRFHSQEYLSLLDPEEGPTQRECRYPALQIPPSQFHLDNLRDRPVIVIAPGGAKNILADDALRRWPIGHYAKLIQQLSRHPFHVVVTGSREDSWIVPHLNGLSYINCIGKFDLLELTALLQHSQLLITHDSGPLHLAKLAQCSTLALFGPTNPIEKVVSSEKCHVLWGGANLSCRPCYNGKTYARCNNNLCLSSLPPELVYEKALNLLAQRESTACQPI